MEVSPQFWKTRANYVIRSPVSYLHSCRFLRYNKLTYEYQEPI